MPPSVLVDHDADGPGPGPGAAGTAAAGTAPAATAESAAAPPQVHPIATLIRLTLVLLYLALVLPLPFLAPQPLQLLLSLAVPVGLVIVLAISSEQVVLDARGIQVGHPRWCAWLLRRGWSLPWSEVQALQAQTTSQGGRVFYVLSAVDGRAWLLPQRVARFELFLSRFAAASGLDCRAVARLTPAWTYQLLAGLSAGLLLAEVAGWLLLPAARI